MNKLTKRHLMLENIILLLVLLNLALPWFDPLHLAQWVYTGIAMTFQAWIDAIGWVMSWTDPLLPRAFTFRGVGNLVFATILTGVLVFVVYAILHQLKKHLGFRLFLKKLQLPFSLMRRSVWALSLIVLLLVAALVPTLLRLFSGNF